MEEADGEKAGGNRLVLLIALVALAEIAAAGFGRVFQGTGTTVRLMIAAGAAALLAGALERRHVLVGALASAAGLAVAIGLLVFPDTTRFFLPTPTTWRAAMTALRAVGHTAEVQVAPALPLAPLMLAAVTAVWTAAFAAHSLAARARSPFLAILPLAALLGFAGVLLEDGARPGYTITFLAAALALLFADGFRRVGHWGPVAVWHGRSRFGVGSASTTRTARRLALTCLGVAAFFPWMLPGFGSTALLKINGDQGQKFISIDPIVDIRPALLSTKPVELFMVRSDRASYWRFLALDTFDGRRWKSSNLQAEGGNFIGGGALQASTGGQAGLRVPGASILHQSFEFEHLTQPWLPAAYDPIAVAVNGSVARYDPEGQVLVAPNGTYQGFTYQVDSELVAPAPRSLDAEPVASGAGIARYTQLPSDTPRQIFDIARRLTAHAEDPYRKVLAVQDFLKSFRYDIRVQPGHTTSELLRFLTVTKRGYCEQFAGSMAVLLRALGIPARVAVGFTPGTFDSKSDVYRVNSQNAHAWVEVLFPRYGWLAFEPTPTRTNPVASTYVSPVTTPTGNVQGCERILPTGACAGSGGAELAGGNGSGKFPNKNRKRVGHDEGVPATGAETGQPLSFSPPPSKIDRWRGRAFEAALLLVLLFLLSIPVAKWAGRRFALARAREPRQRVLASFEVMSLRAADVGLGRRPNETLAEYRSRLRSRVRSLDGSLDLLTNLTARAAYSEGEIGQDQAEQASASARLVIRAIRRAAAGSTRLAGLFRLERYALPR